MHQQAVNKVMSPDVIAGHPGADDAGIRCPGFMTAEGRCNSKQCRGESTMHVHGTDRVQVQIK